MVRDLPTGIVTLLFADVEGSTRLLDSLGEGYGEALHEHRRRLRSAFADNEGVEVDTQGDAFLVAFARASNAVAAAADGQRELADGADTRADGAAHGRAAADRGGIRRPRPALESGMKNLPGPRTSFVGRASELDVGHEQLPPSYSFAARPALDALEAELPPDQLAAARLAAAAASLEDLVTRALGPVA